LGNPKHSESFVQLRNIYRQQVELIQQKTTKKTVFS